MKPGETWRLMAACRGLNSALFFPTRGESVTEALDACARCPVRHACLEHALAAGEKHGIWGGESERSRRRIRAARRLSGIRPAA